MVIPYLNKKLVYYQSDLYDFQNVPDNINYICMTSLYFRTIEYVMGLLITFISSYNLSM